MCKLVVSNVWQKSLMQYSSEFQLVQNHMKIKIVLSLCFSSLPYVLYIGSKSSTWMQAITGLKMLLFNSLRLTCLANASINVSRVFSGGMRPTEDVQCFPCSHLPHGLSIGVAKIFK